ncbi:hypothetical protein B0H14DRAFT_3746715, partial [Mycena olivaceomarginata]
TTATLDVYRAPRRSDFRLSLRAHPCLALSRLVRMHTLQPLHHAPMPALPPIAAKAGVGGVLSCLLLPLFPAPCPLRMEQVHCANRLLRSTQAHVRKWAQLPLPGTPHGCIQTVAHSRPTPAFASSTPHARVLGGHVTSKKVPWWNRVALILRSQPCARPRLHEDLCGGTILAFRAVSATSHRCGHVVATAALGTRTQASSTRAASVARRPRPHLEHHTLLASLAPPPRPSPLRETGFEDSIVENKV